MKILVVSSTVFKVPLTNYGGLEQIAWLTAKGLAEKGHQVALIAPDGSECPNVEIIPCGPARQIDEKMAYNRTWHRYLDFDVVIDSSWNKWSYILKSEGKLKAPILGVMHAPVNTMLQTLPPNVEKPCIVCISEDQKNHFEALFSPAKARRCYNGVDTEFYKPIAGVKRTDRFLFLARFSSIKGADLAIEACKRVGVGLDLVGDSSITSEPEFYERCKAMCDGKQIKMIGPVSRGESVWWLSQAHAFLHPNMRFREPLGLAPVEAQLCGCPVIAWNYGAMRETVPLEGGSVVDSMDAFVEAVKVYANANLEPLRKTAREKAMRFSVENMVNGYHDACVDAVENGGW